MCDILFFYNHVFVFNLDLQFCENLHSDEFETNTFYFTPTNEDYSSKIIFYVEGDEYLNISLQQFDVGFEFNGSEFYKIGKTLFH